MYYRYCQKATGFVNLWTTYLKLPTLFVKIANASKTNSKKAGIIIESHTIVLWKNNIPDRKKFVLILLHEIAHWWYYWNYKNKFYKDESKVIKLSYSWLYKHYPSYWKQLK
jgi:hypothetical protein